MSVTETSKTWSVEQWSVSLDLKLDEISTNDAPDAFVIGSGAIQDIPRPAEAEEGLSHLTRYSSTFTTDQANEPFTFHLGACGEAKIIVDGVEIGRLDSSTLDGAAAATCPITGASYCLCETKGGYDTDDFTVNLGPGQHTLEIVYLAHPSSTGVALDWTPGDAGRQTLDLIMADAPSDTDEEGDGEWGAVEDWPVIPIHSIVLPDGNVLTFGTGEDGQQGAQFVYDVYNPETGTHFTLPNTLGTDIFCSQMVLDPKSGNVVIMGGDIRGNPDVTGVNRGVDDITIFNTKTYTLEEAPEDLLYERWYASVATLSDGSILTIGGINGAGQASLIPEIYDSEGGVRALTGAQMNGMTYQYPSVWERANGDVVVVESRGGDIFLLDTDGTGSMSKVGNLPFSTNWVDPAIMFAEDKVLMVDENGGLWEGDLSSQVPSFEKVADLPGGRNNGNLVVNTDGSVTIIGGTEENGSGFGAQSMAGSQKMAIRYDPDTKTTEILESEELARLYHSTGTLLPDGTILSAGGGAPGPLTNLNGQIYRPANLFDDDGNLAVRPEIWDAPTNISAGDTFTMKVSDANDIQSIGAVRSGGISHSTNVDARFVELDYTVVDDTTIEVTAVDGNVMLPGLWMVSVIDSNDVPSVSALMGVDMAPLDEGSDTAWEATATVRFDDLDAGEWQSVFDFGNGAASDNIIMGQVGSSNDMMFRVYDGSEYKEIVAQGAIVEGEVATFTSKVDENGLMQLYKNASLIAQGPGTIPDDIDRDSNYIGHSNWFGHEALNGEVLFLEHSDIGGEISEWVEPEFAFDVDVVVRFDDLAGGSYQRIFDFGNGPSSDNIFLGQLGRSDDLIFKQYQGAASTTDIRIPDVLVEGEVATFSTKIDFDGQVFLYKNDQLIGQGQGAVPNDVDRTNNLVGESNWWWDTDLKGEILKVDLNGTDIGGEIKNWTAPEVVFDVDATVRFDDLDGGAWQRVFDFGNGPRQDNVLLTQAGNTNGLDFHVYSGGSVSQIKVPDVLVEGEVATYSVQVSSNGLTVIYKDGEVIAQDVGLVPADVDRTSNLVGESNWEADTDLIGEVLALDLNNTDIGGEITNWEPPVDDDIAFEAIVTVRFDDIDSHSWQTVYDFSNGPYADNITLGQVSNSNDMGFYVYYDDKFIRITAEDAIIKGEVAQWRTVVDNDGYMTLYKNDELVAEGQGVVPADVDRDMMLVGKSSWPNDVPLQGEVLGIVHTDVGGVIDPPVGPPIDPPDVDLVYDATVVARFDDVDGGSWQAVYDFGAGQADNNIVLTQFSNSDDMAFYVYDGDKAYKITALDSLVDGEEATWRTTIDENGKMELYKNGELVASGPGVVPNDVERDQMWLGQSNWAGDPPLNGEVTMISHTDVGGEIIDPENPPEGETVFEAEVEVRFDDVDGGKWQSVFDFGNGPSADNIVLTQVDSTNDIAFYVYKGSTAHKIVAPDAIIEGETATWTANVDDYGHMELYKNGELVAEGPGAVPNDVVRENMFTGVSNWPGDTPLIGEVIDITHTDVGGEIENPGEGELAFEISADVTFDDVDGASWQPVFDFGNGPSADNITMTQVAQTKDMAFYVYDGATSHKITAFDAIEEGVEANWKATVDENGYMSLYKDGNLLASGNGAVPNDVVRENMLVGQSNWDGDGPLIGDVENLDVVTMPDGVPDAAADTVEAFLADFPTVDVPEEDPVQEDEDDLITV